MKWIREQFQCYGANSIATSELLAFLLTDGMEQKDALALACRLLDTYGVKGLRNASVDELHQMVGLTMDQAMRLKAVCELTNRFAMLDSEVQVQIKSVDDVVALLRPLMAHIDHEEFRVLVLNTKNIVVANTVLYVGTVNGALLRVAEIYRQAIIRNCPRVILAHSHPSGDPTPSDEDMDTTLQLVEAGKLLDIELLEHIIIGHTDYVSLKERLQW